MEYVQITQEKIFKMLFGFRITEIKIKYNWIPMQRYNMQ